LCQAQRREVGDEIEIAVAGLPAGHLVARHGIHLHVERQQVVAAFGRLSLIGGLDEILRIDPLAHEPTLHVGERNDHRVDLAGGDFLGELLLGQQGITEPA
jgi:hypothetical protein